jgi:OOP family OmpA-OmpF porin
MRSTFTKQHAALAVACTLAFGVFSSAANAQAMDPNEKALVVDSQGSPVKSGNGDCVHSGFGPAPAWNAACHAPIPVPVAQAAAPAPAPAAVAPDPVPAPMAAPLVALVPVIENVKFDADVLFDSGRSGLRPAGGEALDAFIGRIRELESQSVIAVGHADRMGSDSANQALSAARVSTVKSYLVSKGLAGDRIQTSAVGETQPSTTTGDCKDARSAANIACLQADRRVVIEVSGSRITR